MVNTATVPRGTSEAIHRQAPGLWLRTKTRLRIICLAMRAEAVVEEVEAPPSSLGWDTVAGVLQDLEGYSSRRLAIGPGTAIGMEDLVAALEAMGYPLTGRRVVLTLIHGYEGQLTPSAPRGAIHEEHGGRVKTETKEPRVNDEKIEEGQA